MGFNAAMVISLFIVTALPPHSDVPMVIVYGALAFAVPSFIHVHLTRYRGVYRTAAWRWAVVEGAAVGFLPIGSFKLFMHTAFHVPALVVIALLAAAILAWWAETNRRRCIRQDAVA